MPSGRRRASGRFLVPTGATTIRCWRWRMRSACRSRRKCSATTSCGAFRRRCSARHCAASSSNRGHSCEGDPPDLTISTGLRSVPVVRELKRRSRGKTRSVHLGFPRISPRHFDLVVPTPEYPVPDAPNVLRIPFALTPHAARSVEQSDREPAGCLPAAPPAAACRRADALLAAADRRSDRRASAPSRWLRNQMAARSWRSEARRTPIELLSAVRERSKPRPWRSCSSPATAPQPIPR